MTLPDGRRPCIIMIAQLTSMRSVLVQVTFTVRHCSCEKF